MRTCIRCVLSVFVLALAAPGQRTWVVDALNRPGTDFTDIPPAVAAAAAGDTIVVLWSNNYTAPTLSRPLRIVGVSDNQPYPVWVRGRWIVRDIPAGSEVVISNFRLWPLGGAPAQGFVATNCAGRLLLENVQSNSGGLISFPISFTDCADVSLHWCALTAEYQPVAFVRSRARIANSSVVGVTSGIPIPPSALTEAMRVENGEVRLVFSAVEGSSGSATMASKNGLVLANGTLYLGPGSTLHPGRVPNSVGTYVYSGLAAVGTGTILMDPQTLIWALQPTVQLRDREQPAVSTELVTRGQTFRAFVHGSRLPIWYYQDQHQFAPPGPDLALLALGVPTLTPTPTSLGNVWLDPNTLMHVATGLLDNQGLLIANLTCGATMPIDQPFAFQAAILRSNGPVLLTEPVFFTVQWPIGQSWP